MSSAATTEIDDSKIAKKNFFERFPQVGLYDGEIHQKNMDFFKLLASPDVFKKCDVLFDPLSDIIKNKELLEQMRTLNVANFDNYYEDHFIKGNMAYKCVEKVDEITYTHVQMNKSMAMCLVMHLYH
jgi:hypothetical protein